MNRAAAWCRVCREPNPDTLIDFGDQPISNRYLPSATSDEAVFPRVLAQCTRCGIVQFAVSIPAKELRPRSAAARFGEPESHLDELTRKLVNHVGLKPGSVIFGLSYKDQSLLERFERLGFQHTVGVDIARDLQESCPTAGIETLQALFDEKCAARLAAVHGPGSLLVTRRVLEHVHDFQRFGCAVQEVLAPDGFLMVEEPDFSLAMELREYSTIWEERTVFFTPVTLALALGTLGFDVRELYAHPYPLEPALVAIARAGCARSQKSDSARDVHEEIARGRAYATAYPSVCARTRGFLADFKQQNGAVAIFGAGHMACNFINLLGLRDVIDFAVDDNPAKKGLFLPGSRLPILDSSALVQKDVRLCLLTVRPEIEEAIIGARAEFTAKGGVFASILPNGPRSLRRLLACEHEN